MISTTGHTINPARIGITINPGSNPRKKHAATLGTKDVIVKMHLVSPTLWKCSYKQNNSAIPKMQTWKLNIKIEMMAVKFFDKINLQKLEIPTFCFI